MTRWRSAAALVSVLTLLPVLGSCSRDEQPRTDPRTALATAKRNLDSTSGVRIGLTAQGLPSGVNGLLGAHGVGTHAPAFTGTIKVATSGFTADAAVVSVGPTVYAKLPFTSKFVPIDPADYGAPNPSDLLDRKRGLSSWLTAATRVRQGKQVRDGQAVLTGYSGTVPGTAVARLIPSARSSANFAARFTLDDRTRLAKAVLTGPFYPEAEKVTYTVTLDDYGIRRDIKAP